VPAMQKRMINAIETIPGVERVGLVNNYPPLVYAAGSRANVFNEETRDLRPSNAAAMPFRYDVSPEYFYAAGTSLLAGRGFSWHDDKNAPAVAVVNREFAGKIWLLAPQQDCFWEFWRAGCWPSSCIRQRPAIP
jgi:hypothetical protein